MNNTYSISGFKKNAKRVLKRHYLLMVALLLFAVFLGTNFGNLLTVYKLDMDSELGRATVLVAKDIVAGNFEEAFNAASGNREELAGTGFNVGSVEFGRKKGVFSDAVNIYSSGSIIASVASAILNLTNNPSATSVICMVLALIFIGSKTVFVSQIYKVVYTRMFLECRIYDKVGVPSITHLFRVKRWLRASLAYLRYNISLGLWWITIVGGVIKHYSYFVVRFILAENPSLSGKEAITLSKKMMKGHKFEAFRLDLSFIGWDIISIITGGVAGVLYTMPYKEAARAEYYSYLRWLSKLYKIEGAEELNDKYLFEVAEKTVIDDVYGDVIDIMNQPKIELEQPSKVRAFFQNVFGVVLRYDRQEMRYRKVMSQKAGVEAYKNIVDGFSYPYRLSPVEIPKSRKSLEHQMYMRHYSVYSIILIFFSFCLVGWLWEVAIHIVNDGRFVNRGVLHGPWLPIYGFGAVLILMVLNKFRNRPPMEFMMAILLCGFVEYFGSWMLEKLFDTKWWDYTGYFLNVNGRICAEGLLAFGVAGIGAVYFLAPLLDNIFMKIKRSMRNPLCVLLLVVFIIDVFYSSIVPNTGEGITDYGEEYVVENISANP